MCQSWASIFFLCILNNRSRETEVGGEKNGEDSLSGHEVSSRGLLSRDKQRGEIRGSLHMFVCANVHFSKPLRCRTCPAKSQNCQMHTSIFFHTRHSGAGRIYRMTNRLSAPLRCKLVQLYCWTISTDAQRSVSGQPESIRKKIK